MTKPHKKHFSMLRSFVLADLITLTNAACGAGSIFMCLRYLADQSRTALWLAIALLPLAVIFDFMDGAEARWRQQH